jgi:hypothetical protein
MGTITTSLHYGYQPNLDALWGMREIVSNAFDGEERHSHLGIGRMSVSYSKRSQTLVVRNEGVTVPSTALLMGTSDSREEEDCIGQFGEGLPMGLLAMGRDPLLDVTIYNGGEKWEPRIERSSAYGSEPVLVVKTRKLRSHRDAFEVHVKGVSHEQYMQLRSNFLRLDGAFDPVESIHRDEGGKERVLLQPEYHGKIYNKGVFVMQRDDLMFGYDLHGELNRDRHMMNEYTLQRDLTKLLDAAIRYNDERFAQIFTDSMFESNGTLELESQYSDLAYNSALRARVAQVFTERYGMNAVAVEEESEIEEAKAIGLHGVRCSPLLGKILRASLGTLSGIQKQRKRSVQMLWDRSSLPSAQREVFGKVVLLVQSALPEAKEMTFEVATFGSNDVPYTTHEDEHAVRLAYAHLLDFEATLVAAVSGANSLLGRWDNSASVLSRIVAQLAQGKGTASLALTLIAEEG